MSTTFKIARLCDPAIADISSASSLKYSTTREFALLEFIEGSKPTVFHGRRLTVSEWGQVQNCVTEADKFQAAFCRGLVKVDDLVLEEGASPIVFIRPTDHSGKDRVIPDSVLESHFDPATIQEIGSVIYYKSFLARTPGRYFPLPDICRAAVSATMYRRAELMSASSSSTAAKPPAAAPPATPPTSSPDGDASTAATATG